MRIKKYVAKSMREALCEIRTDLGESAVILKSRKIPAKAFPFGGMDIEVTAAIDEESAPRQSFQPIKIDKPGIYTRPKSSCVVDDLEQVTIRPWKPPLSVPAVSKQASVPALSAKDASDYSEIREDIKQLAAMVKSVLITGGTDVLDGFTGGCAVLYKKLIDAEVSHSTATTLVKSIEKNAAALSNGQAETKILELLRDHFPASGPIRCKKNGPMVVAFVGPTGAGKTTTLAKLAAHCRLNRDKRVSIITADTYRIAAIEQIRTFADILKAELQVVFSPAEVPAALAACVNDDLVFIDTAGRSQQNAAHMEELKAMLGAIKPDEVHLVVSATTKDSDLAAAIDRYREAGANRLLFTKLDETLNLGNVFNAVSASGMPVSFLTFGQGVPDDIELAQPARFVQRLWKGNAS